MSVRNLLFHFQHYAQALRGGAVLAEWRYTAAAEPVTHFGNQFVPRAITLGGVSLNAERSSGQVEIRLPVDDTLAQSLFAGLPAGSVWLQVIETDGLVTRVWFSGTVRSVSAEDDKAKLQCSAVIYLIQRPALRLRYSKECQWDHYGPRCGVDKAAHKQTVQVQSVSADGLTIGIGEPITSGDFVNGLLQKGGASRMVVENTASSLTLFVPLPGLQAGDTVDIYPGCDRTTGANGCGKFSNILRHGGFPHVPESNPFTAGLV